MILIPNRYRLFFHYALECTIILNYACECPIIPRIMPAKSVTYNSPNYAGTLGSGLPFGQWSQMMSVIYLMRKNNISMFCSLDWRLLVRLYLSASFK